MQLTLYEIRNVSTIYLSNISAIFIIVLSFTRQLETKIKTVEIENQVQKKNRKMNETLWSNCLIKCKMKWLANIFIKLTDE